MGNFSAKTSFCFKTLSYVHENRLKKKKANNLLYSLGQFLAIMKLEYAYGCFQWEEAAFQLALSHPYFQDEQGIWELLIVKSYANRSDIEMLYSKTQKWWLEKWKRRKRSFFPPPHAKIILRSNSNVIFFMLSNAFD